ncbi:MAG: hypothetical protein JWM11_6383 [Planctomycetaceae bacterium]|nr:hypothetical protein [Planctomycetaceae bacterium]
MTSNSVSDYRLAARSFIGQALSRPSMFFKTLDQLESIMYGHGFAYQQMLFVTNDETFNIHFSDWLYERKTLSCSSGWAYAIEQYCAKRKQNSVRAFTRYVSDFFENWNVGPLVVERVTRKRQKAPNEDA